MKSSNRPGAGSAIILAVIPRELRYSPHLSIPKRHSLPFQSVVVALPLPMFLAVSPYHLTTREAPAMAALLLAERVVTLMPTPFEGTAQEVLGRVVERVPRYLDFMKSWEWATPLWESGLISSVFEGLDAVDEVREVCRRIQRDPSLTSLRSLMRPGLFDDEEDYLDAVARDLLKAGPDPGVSVPVVAGLDRFATRLGLIVVRPEAASVAQRAEMRAAHPLISIAAPVLLQAGAEAVLETRMALDDTLSPLREAISAAAAEAAGDVPPTDDTIEQVRLSAAAYAAAFAELSADGGLECGDDEVRVIHGQVALSLVSLPVDAVLGSSLAAMTVLNGAARGPSVEAGDSELVERDPLAGRRVLSLIVRPIGHRAARR